ncbi:uncharacterized protein LOC118800067 isoform X2 [Colossoma macropomum]|uniref:uncharacterized protein LOC118800067 isoform X2 n=1 Tax=Colossoma macropomum TaxID=42526 RepID=UPI0018654497|nr:uncharacterized protein LOC118800067 isoform X2 [Colossoma macropomum]
MALFILISFHLILQVQLQNVPQAELSVFPAVLTQRGSVQLDCKTLYAGVSQCYFYPERDETNLKHSPSCQLSLTGSELTAWTGHSYRSSQSVNITCYYTVDEFRTQAESPHSLPAPVTVQVLDAPQLSVSTSGRSSVQLNCTPPYVGVSQCYFYPEGHERDLKFPSCQLSLTGAELTTWAGRNYSSLQPVNVICYYSVKISDRWFTSPHSLPAPVRILDKKPNMTVSHDDQRHEFTLVCEISLSLSADVGCDFYIEDEKLMWMMSQRTRSGSLACRFTPHKDFLFSRMKSAKRREVSCDYSLNSDQTVHSPLSDSYSLTQLPPLPTPETTTQLIKPKSTTATYTVPTHHSEATTASLTTHSKHHDHIQIVSRRTFLIMLLSTTSVSVLLAGVMIVCLCRFIRKQSTERLFKVDSKSGNQGDMITMASAQDTSANSASNFHYSVINCVPTPSQPSGPFGKTQDHSEDKKDVEYHMYCSITDTVTDS